MIAVWLLVPVVAVAFVAVVAAVRALADETARMQREVGAWSSLQPALVELRDATHDARATVRSIRRQ